MTDNSLTLHIRHAAIDDLEAIAELEILCFPEAEAATKEKLKSRLQTYPECFWLLELDGHLVSMVNGMMSNSDILCDEMYSDSSLHDGEGNWQMIFGVATHPEYRHMGYGGRLLARVIGDVGKRNRKGVVLTCKEHMIHFYEGFGFINEGISRSAHGGEVWYQMKLDTHILRCLVKGGWYRHRKVDVSRYDAELKKNGYAISICAYDILAEWSGVHIKNRAKKNYGAVDINFDPQHYALSKFDWLKGFEATANESLYPIGEVKRNILYVLYVGESRKIYMGSKDVLYHVGKDNKEFIHNMFDKAYKPVKL